MKFMISDWNSWLDVKSMAFFEKRDLNNVCIFRKDSNTRCMYADSIWRISARRYAILAKQNKLHHPVDDGNSRFLIARKDPFSWFEPASILTHSEFIEKMLKGLPPIDKAGETWTITKSGSRNIDELVDYDRLRSEVGYKVSVSGGRRIDLTYGHRGQETGYAGHLSDIIELERTTDGIIAKSALSGFYWLSPELLVGSRSDVVEEIWALWNERHHLK